MAIFVNLSGDLKSTSVGVGLGYSVVDSVHGNFATSRSGMNGFAAPMNYMTGSLDSSVVSLTGVADHRFTFAGDLVSSPSSVSGTSGIRKQTLVSGNSELNGVAAFTIKFDINFVINPSNLYIDLYREVGKVIKTTGAVLTKRNYGISSTRKYSAKTD